MLSKEEIEIDHTKDSFCVRIPLITEQELKRIDDNLDSITNELTKQIIHDKELAIAQHIIQKQKDKIDELEQENKNLEMVLEIELDKNKKYCFNEDGNTGKCLGYSNVNDDEPCEYCQSCEALSIKGDD